MAGEQTNSSPDTTECTNASLWRHWTLSARDRLCSAVLMQNCCISHTSSAWWQCGPSTFMYAAPAAIMTSHDAFTTLPCCAVCIA